MFKCALCKKQSEPGQKALKKVLDTTYVVHKDKVFNYETRRWETIETTGTQIVKEAVCCADCYSKED
jgi:hypothetical protein